MSARDSMHDAILAIFGGGDGGSRKHWAAHMLASMPLPDRLALARALVPEHDWQPIGTAPMDADVLVWNAATGAYRSRWTDGEWPMGFWERLGDWYPRPPTGALCRSSRRRRAMNDRDMGVVLNQFALAYFESGDAKPLKTEALKRALAAVAPLIAKGERERCARMADAFPARTHGALATAPYAAAEQASEEIAAAIRALD